MYFPFADWVLAFKGATGNDRNMLADWTHTGDFLNADEAQLISNTAKNYRNNFIYNSWNTIPIQKVLLVISYGIGIFEPLFVIKYLNVLS